MVVTCKCGEELTFFSNDGADIEIKLEATNGNIKIINDVGAEFINGNDEVTTSINTSTQQVLISNKTFFITPIVTENTADNVNYSTATVIDGICSRDCVGQDRTDQLPTATSIVAAIKNCQVGTTFSFILRNTGTDKILTLGNALGGITLSDNVNIAPGTTKRFTFMITDVDTPTIVSYVVGDSFISTDSFTNTHSLKFTDADQKYEGTVSTGFPLSRPGSGAGASDAWSVSSWLKTQDVTGGGHFWGAQISSDHLMFLSYDISVPSTNVSNKLVFAVGPVLTGNYVELITPYNSLPQATWVHILMTYDGGTTGGGDSFATIKSRFKIFIDGVSQTPLGGTAPGSGWSGAFEPTAFGLALTFSVFPGVAGVDSFVDELAVFDYDAQTSISSIYNSGIPADLSNTGGLTPPVHWWRWTDSDTSASVADHIGNIDLTGTGMDTATNIVEDVPPSPFSNLRSLKFTINTQYYKNPAPVSFPWCRTTPTLGNVGWSPWSISFWFKSPDVGGPTQILGAEDVDVGYNRNLAIFKFNSEQGNYLQMYLGESITDNAIILCTPHGSIGNEVWQHILVTYDGLVIGSLSGPPDSYAVYSSRFNIYLDGVSMDLSCGQLINNGCINAFEFNNGNFGVGLVVSGVGNPGIDQYTDELAVFDYDAQAVVSNIYNNGTPADLSNTPGLTPPVHWWRWTDSDTGASVADHIGSFDLTGSNLVTATNIVADVPPSPPQFTNIFSLLFTANDQKYEGSPPVGFPLDRPGSGAGASDAWSVSMWYKGLSAIAGPMWNAKVGTLYGMSFNQAGSTNYFSLTIGNILTGIVTIRTPDDSIVPNTWMHTLVTYDGDTTGGADNITTIKSRFKIYVDGVSENLSGSKAGTGWSGAFEPTAFGVGDVWEFAQGPTSGQYIDELAVFDYDAQSVVSNIYNSGTPTDLSNTQGLTSPVHWWRWTASDSASALADHIGSYDLTGSNLNASNINVDVP